MKEGTIYDRATGRVVMSVVSADEETIMLQTQGKPELEVLMDVQLAGMTHYVADGKPAERPDLELSLSGDVFIGVNEIMRVDGIPEGCRLVYPGGTTTVNDGFIEWSAVEPGEYVFRFERFPNKEVRINAIVG